MNVKALEAVILRLGQSPNQSPGKKVTFGSVLENDPPSFENGASDKIFHFKAIKD